jgi:hypothetical protein
MHVLLNAQFSSVLHRVVMEENQQRLSSANFYFPPTSWFPCLSSCFEFWVREIVLASRLRILRKHFLLLEFNLGKNGCVVCVQLIYVQINSHIYIYIYIWKKLNWWVDLMWRILIICGCIDLSTLIESLNKRKIFVD